MLSMISASHFTFLKLASSLPRFKACSSLYSTSATVCQMMNLFLLMLFTQGFWQSTLESFCHSLCLHFDKMPLESYEFFTVLSLEPFVIL
jgi:hypothetical protein